jgi:hypothetical protein
VQSGKLYFSLHHIKKVKLDFLVSQEGAQLWCNTLLGNFEKKKDKEEKDQISRTNLLNP